MIIGNKAMSVDFTWSYYKGANLEDKLFLYVFVVFDVTWMERKATNR